ncbi:MAG TPA: type II secretion system protein GspK [Phycisphaerae bacterium]|nr:type II secretion system protein GspK [Phycisphaerae bacterium]
MRPARNPLAARRPARRGTILIVTLWIVLVLAGLTLMLARAMRVEAVCAANELAALQAEAIEQGAVQYVLSRVDSLQGEGPVESDTPCEVVRVGAGAFWILRPDYENDAACVYGISDEAAKANLNIAPVEMLAKLPGMTQELAASVVDWRDGDANPTPGGAESEYYLLLPEPYQCKNAPLETVEELLLVKDFTPEILFGEDVNRNGMLDANEDDADVSAPPDDRNGALDRGLAPFVTVHSVEPNISADGERRVNLNDVQNQQPLFDLLREKLSADRAIVLTDRVRRERPFRNVLDFHIRAGLTPAEFQAVADHLTTNPASVLRGLVNVNTAPRAVLASLPGLDDTDAAALIAKRSESGVDLGSVAWVAQALRPEKAVAIGDFITTRTYRFSADIVSVAGNGRAFRRCRIVVDAQTSPPKVLYRQDLTHLGWPLSQDILDKIRAGTPLDEIATTRTVLQEAQ